MTADTEPDTDLPPIPELEVDAKLRKGVKPHRRYLDRTFHRAYDFAVSFGQGVDDLFVGIHVGESLSAPRRIVYPPDVLPRTSNDRLIIHGRIGDRPYAWVEIGDVLFDPGVQRFYDRAAWYEATAAEKHAEYQADEAGVFLVEHHSYGPWPRTSATAPPNKP